MRVDDKVLGRRSWHRPATPYEQYCDDQGIPIYRGMLGIKDVRELELGPWERLGGRGAVIDLDGMGGLTGSYVVEVPAGGALNPERHLYEEVFYVLEGSGTTEVWLDGDEDPQLLEWRRNTVFSVPLNAWHRLVNGTDEPALVLVASNAPPVMQLFDDVDFVFGTPYHFRRRYDRSADYFQAWTELGTDETTGRALNAGAVVPDVVDCEVPLSGQRGEGHRHFYIRLCGNFFRGHVAEYPVGRYSKTHAHEAGPVLVCLAGTGYTLTWPKSAGTTPWQDGKADLVRRQDYQPGGLVSAAPGGADWFHAHFATSKQPLRVMAWLGGYPQRTEGAPGSLVVSRNEDLKLGGNTIEYRDEDPMVRQIFQKELEASGVVYDMPDSLFE